MRIGIDASRAFVKNRTGIEEYSYQVIKSLRNKLDNTQVFLYLRSQQKIDFKLPENWRIKIIKWPYLWTQAGLSLELLFHPTDVLFVPAHVVPIIRPKNTVVVIHGLEYEFCPDAYSFWERLYMRWSIKNSCKWAKKIIAVSNNTKKDLINLYKVPEGKIKVIYEGISDNFQFSILNFQSIFNDKISNFQTNTKYHIPNTTYLLFIGRLEKRKNIDGIIEAFEILKEKYKIPHRLVLVGKPGFGFAKSRYKIQDTRYKDDIILKGFVSEEEKTELLQNADVFLFPSFYEGFGLPILEAQAAGVPVVTSNVSSMPEISTNYPAIAGPRLGGGELDTNIRTESAILVNPKNPQEIAEAAFKLISNEELRKSIIERGLENVKRFDWKNCAEEIAELIEK